jgi:hypothetical protein
MALHHEEFPRKKERKQEDSPKTIGVHEEDIIQWGVLDIYISEHHVVLLAAPIALAFLVFFAIRRKVAIGQWVFTIPMFDSLLTLS